MKTAIKTLGIFLLLALAGSFLLFRAEPPEGIRNAVFLSQEAARSVPAAGPLRLSGATRLYFTDSAGKAVYLTGSHVWNNLQDIDPAFQTNTKGKMIEPKIEHTPKFDFSEYLRFLAKENHNFIRLWSWEEAAWVPWLVAKPAIQPLPYPRTGPGLALDGKPKFNLTELNQEYFDRLRSRVSEAGEHGVYVSVMLFQGWSIDSKDWPPKTKPWRGHPFHRDNNINGVNGDPNGDDEGTEAHTLQVPQVTALQESYVRKVVATLNDLDNVLWEISNESDGVSKDWQYHMINFIKQCEADQPKQHLVGMTACFPRGENADLFNSPADWISPISWRQENYRDDPPPADGRKVILSDTDHIFGIGGNRAWVWKSFTRGLNPIFMDPVDMPQWEAVRRTMGMTRAYANRMNLSAAKPLGDVASSGYCLANPGEEYLVYAPLEVPWLESRRFIHRLKRPIRNVRRLFETKVTLDLSSYPSQFRVEWLNPSSGEIKMGPSVKGGTKLSLTAPFKGDAVLYVRKES